MIIDSHVHFWQYNALRDSWITDEMKPIQKDFLPADASSVFMQNDVDGCIAVQASQSDTETAFLLQLAQENPFIKGVVGWIDLAGSDLDLRLEACKSLPKLKGFRHVVQGEPEGFLQRSEIINGIKSIGDAGFTYDILIYAHQLGDAIKLSDALPNQPFILDHCAKPSLRSKNTEEWSTQIRELAANPNVSCKLSGLLTEDHWHNCDEKQLLQCLDVVFSAFGTQRVLFGSDWPVILLAGHYKSWKKTIENYTLQFTQQEREAIFGSNAVRFYNL